MEQCQFCSGLDVVERHIVRDDLVTAFPTNIPIVPMHTLIIPNRHISTFEELTRAERDAISALLIRLQSVFRQRFGATGFNVAWNEGFTAGQAIPHLHVHVLPRKTGDTGITEYEPRKFLYRPGSREKTPESELQAVAESIRQALE